ncbi:2-phospho-L-lactate guanylyltransferase [Solicola gregarius]|uniref:Phosphoenolpyruvate guanylyltransferase n=1 Tax=Solicola gregarius TaxID=2908642 RepID=A0AA46TIA3_9ACTN|nr:2-phospho-L-lactate guanylyltransferase [Solicola gregarius]UYM05706.1 2-phospho-L-lactate guanylyltransferase [Solicola gregarius]
MTVEPYAAWSVIVPAKAADRAKTRLAPAYGGLRPAMARAFALDTIRAAGDCDRVALVIVVSDDDVLADKVRDRHAVRLVADPGLDLNAAIRAGADVAPPGDRVAVIPADLPALTGPTLATALSLAEPYERAVVADGEGVGTTLLSARTPARLRPAFGQGSLGVHKAGGAVVIDLRTDSALRRDVDVPRHLTEAAMLGVGPSTRRVLERLRRREETEPVTDSASSR